MRKFEVTIEQGSILLVTVEAENIEEAEKIAEEKYSNNDYEYVDGYHMITETNPIEER